MLKIPKLVKLSQFGNVRRYLDLREFHEIDGTVVSRFGTFGSSEILRNRYDLFVSVS